MEKPSKISVCTWICNMFFIGFWNRIRKQTIRLFTNRKINTENLIKVLCLPLEFIAQSEQTKDIYRMSWRKCLLVCLQRRRKILKGNLWDITLAKSEEKKQIQKLFFILLVFEKRLIVLDVEKKIIKKTEKSGQFSRIQEKSINQSILSNLIDCYSLSFSFYPYVCLFMDIPLLIPYRWISLMKCHWLGSILPFVCTMAISTEWNKNRTMTGID